MYNNSVLSIIFLTIFSNIFTFPLLEDCEILDMSYDYSNDTVYWGSMIPFRVLPAFKGNINSGYFVQYFNFHGPEHSGTHLDAPAHFVKNGVSTDKVKIEKEFTKFVSPVPSDLLQGGYSNLCEGYIIELYVIKKPVPLKSLIGEACVIDVSDKVRQNKDYQMTIDDVQQWEKTNGKLDSKCIVIMRTGWEKKYANKSEYFGGTQNISDTTTYHFPGLLPATAKWLAESNRLKAFGIDSPSIDYALTTDHGTHRVLLPRNITGIENMMNLDKLPNRGATIIAMPMKIKDGTGGPLRVISVGWNGPKDPCRRGK